MFLLFKLMTNISCLFYCKFLKMTNLGGQVHERRARSVSGSPPLCQSHFQNRGRQVSRLNFVFTHLALVKFKFLFSPWTVRWSESLNWHNSILGYLREPIVQHQNHYITCFETCLPLSPGTFEIASTRLS